MKKTLFLVGLFLALAVGSSMQKFALIDMEYILENPSLRKWEQTTQNVSNNGRAKWTKPHKKWRPCIKISGRFGFSGW